MFGGYDGKLRAIVFAAVMHRNQKRSGKLLLPLFSMYIFREDFMKIASVFMVLLEVSMFFAAIPAAAQLTPEVTSWLLNTDGKKGYNNIPSNVQQVRYSGDWVYVSCTCIPGYDIGPWQANPNTPMNQDFTFKITRSPQKNAGTLTATPLGHVGVWANGVSIFNASDARSYNNRKIWNQNAIVVEGISFDKCLGHPAPNGEYHHHLNPTCLYDDRDSSKHSPVIGYAFDGFPIYGAYGYANTDGTGKFTRMRSSYRTRNMSNRKFDLNGESLEPTDYGPDISAQFPLGYYIEDFEYVAGSGDLDEHNGRFCTTPEYPNGIYAYFVTLDATGAAAFPYTVGATYYGRVPPGNTGPQSGHNTPTEAVQTYTPVSSADDENIAETGAYPNPASERISVAVPEGGAWRVAICDALGREYAAMESVRGGETITLPTAELTAGGYAVKMTSGAELWFARFVVTR
jgi:hypothetical protein